MVGRGEHVKGQLYIMTHQYQYHKHSPFFQLKDLRVGESSSRFSLLVQLCPPILPLLRFQRPLQICEWCFYFVVAISNIAIIFSSEAKKRSPSSSSWSCSSPPYHHDDDDDDERGCTRLKTNDSRQENENVQWAICTSHFLSSEDDARDGDGQFAWGAQGESEARWSNIPESWIVEDCSSWQGGLDLYFDRCDSKYCEIL